MTPLLAIALLSITPLEVKSAEVVPSGNDVAIRVDVAVTPTSNPFEVQIQNPRGWTFTDSHVAQNIEEPYYNSKENRLLFERVAVGNPFQVTLYFHGGPEAAKTVERIKAVKTFKAWQVN